MSIAVSAAVSYGLSCRRCCGPLLRPRTSKQFQRKERWLLASHQAKQRRSPRRQAAQAASGSIGCLQADKHECDQRRQQCGQRTRAIPGALPLLTYTSLALLPAGPGWVCRCTRLRCRCTRLRCRRMMLRCRPARLRCRCMMPRCRPAPRRRWRASAFAFVATWDVPTIHRHHPGLCCLGCDAAMLPRSTASGTDRLRRR